MGMNWLNIVLLCISFFEIFFLVGYYEKRISLTVALAVLFYVGEYIVIAAILFWIDEFAILYILLVQVILNFIGIALKYMKEGNLPRNLQLDFSPFLFIILITALLFTFIPFSYFGMGQDEGVYQVKAIDLMYGSTARVKDFDEYHALSEENQVQYSMAVKTNLLGYDLYDPQKPTLSVEEKTSEVTGIYHGIPTYPAILALAGSAFGIKNMLVFNKVFFLCYLVFVFYICKNLNFNMWAHAITVFIALLSSVNIWVAKSSLAELIIMLLFATYLYFITGDRNRNNIFFSGLMVCIFSFFHVTIYTMLPLFFLIYIMLYLKDKKKDYLYSNCLISLVFMIGINFMLWVAPNYTTNNIVRPLCRFLPFVDDQNCVLILMSMASLFGLISILCLVSPKLINKMDLVTKSEQYINLVRVICILLVCLCGRQLLASKYFQSGNILKAFQENSLIAYCFLTGIVILPITIFFGIKKCKNMLQDSQWIVIFISFVYCVLFRSAILSPTVAHYYYYSRYLAPYIILVALMAGRFVNGYKVCCLLSAVLCISLLPYDLALAMNQDDTRMQWETIENICANITEEDAVIISDSFVSTLFLPIREITNASVYPIMGDSIETEMIDLAKHHENVYYVTSSELLLLNNKFRPVYLDYFVSSEDLQAYRVDPIPFPLNFQKNKNQIFLYQYDEKHQYIFKASEVVNEGFDEEESGFIWSNEHVSSLKFDTLPHSCSVKIYFMPYIPYEKLGMQEFPLEIYINQSYYETIDLMKSENEITLLFKETDTAQVPLILEFHSPIWSPSDYGSGDTRTLGFAVQNIEIQNLNRG